MGKCITRVLGNATKFFPMYTTGAGPFCCFLANHANANAVCQLILSIRKREMSLPTFPAATMALIGKEINRFLSFKIE